MMHGHEKSDPNTVAEMSANNAVSAAAEVMPEACFQHDGAKGGDRGERERAKRAPDIVPEARLRHDVGPACHRRSIAYGPQPGKGRRNGSHRSCTTSTLSCSRCRFSPSSVMRLPA